MAALDFIRNFVISNLLTVYYCFFTLLLFAVNFLKNPFADPWAQKLRLEPPAPLTDPRYGTHKYIKVNNIKLHYVESGDPSKHLMIFLHGFPEFWYSWRHQIVEFNKNYWCIAVDMRGYGDSEKPENLASYKLDLLVEDIYALIKELGREKCILVAHDWGGLVACGLRDAHPEALNALVVLASASHDAFTRQIWTNPQQRQRSWYVFMYRAPWFAERLFQMNNLESLDKLMLMPGNEYVTTQDIECYKYWFGKPTAMTPPVNYYRANFQYVPFDKRKSSHNVPFLLASPTKDPYIDTAIQEEMKKEYEVIETALVEDVGHFIQQENPVVANRLIREFLKKHNF